MIFLYFQSLEKEPISIKSESVTALRINAAQRQTRCLHQVDPGSTFRAKFDEANKRNKIKIRKIGRFSRMAVI